MSKKVILAGVVLTFGVLFGASVAKQGADDPVGHVRGGNDPKGHQRIVPRQSGSALWLERRGADDPAGHGPRGADDPKPHF